MIRTIQLTTVLVLAFMIKLSFGQISITQEDVSGWLSAGNTLSAHSDTTSQIIDIGSPGGESVWDFSNIHPDVNYDIQVINPSRTEFDTSYSASNVASYYQDEVNGSPYEHWLYYTLNDQHLILYGNVIRQPQIPDITQTSYTPPRIIYNFPIDYNTNWSQNLDGEVVLWHDGIPTTIESGTYSISASIDGYGSITFPDGSNNNALRIKYDVRKIFQRDYSRQITYTWLTISGKRFTVISNDTTSNNGQITAQHITWAYPSNQTEVTENQRKPVKYTLSQNYPNPFNPSTKINYEVPAESKVTIKVYNSIGKEVKTLINQNQSAGIHTVSFNAEALPSGIYFARMKAGSFNNVIKMTLIK